MHHFAGSKAVFLWHKTKGQAVQQTHPYFIQTNGFSDLKI
jgi:hypothetical protein